jgi:hypothetical protein
MKHRLCRSLWAYLNYFYHLFILTILLFLFRITFTLLIIAMNHILLSTLPLGFLIQGFVRNNMHLFRLILLPPRPFLSTGKIQRKAILWYRRLFKRVVSLINFLFDIDELSLSIYQSSLIWQFKFLKGRGGIIRLLLLWSYIFVMNDTISISTRIEVTIISTFVLILTLFLFIGFHFVLGIEGIDSIIIFN